jgi:putative selenium metabolism hydrolase
MSHSAGPADLLDARTVGEIALKLVRERSLSCQEQAVARLVAEEMQELGLAVDVDDLGNVIGTLDAGPGPCILLDTHLDTVGVGDRPAWTHSPEGEMVGDRLYGRGAMDMKGPLAACLCGIASLRDRLQRGKVVVSATIAEEMLEGPATVHVAERVRPDLAIICEASRLRLAHGQRGRAELRVDVYGRSTHSSRPKLGVNAAQAMLDVVYALRSLQPPHHDVLGDGILVLTDLMSAPYPANSVVPNHCAATFDRRTLPGETADGVLAPIAQCLDLALAGSGAHGTVAIAVDDFTAYTGARVSGRNFADAWYRREDDEIVQCALRALQDAGIEARTTHYAFCTNGSGTAGMGIPTVGFGPGDERLAHRSDEYVDIQDLAAAARGYAALVQHYIAMLG